MDNQKKEDLVGRKCLNCNNQLSDGDVFCNNCGQSVQQSKRPIAELLLDLVNSVLGLDGRLLQTLKMFFVPAYLPKAYIEGKRMTYLPPSRLFIITLILHISTILFISNFGELDTHSEYGVLEKERLAMKYDTIANTLFDSTEVHKKNKIRSELFDTLIADSKFFNGKGSSSLLDSSLFDITKRDVYTLSADSIIKKYKVSSFSSKLFVKQFLKLNKNRSQALKFALANLLWGILAVIVLLAMIMKLLYWRSKRYYIEHLTLLLHNHAVAFFLTSILILIGHYLENQLFIFSGYFLSGIYFFISLRRYYGQGFIKTIVKFIILGGFYCIIFFGVAIVVSLLSLVIF